MVNKKVQLTLLKATVVVHVICCSCIGVVVLVVNVVVLVLLVVSYHITFNCGP